MSFFGNSTPPDEDDERQERPVEAAPLSLPATVPPASDPYPVFDTERPPSQVWRRTRRIAWELTQTLALAALIFFAVRAMAQNFRVEGASMEPGLHNGQYLLVNKAVYLKINLEKLSKYIPFIDPGDRPQRFLFRSPKRGDVIVFRFPQDPTRDFIKRVIAVPGDTVEVKPRACPSGSNSCGSDVIVNGSVVEEPYISAEVQYTFARQTVPDGQYFVLGDNRNNSYDSHLWGFLPEENIIGQAMVSYWPLKEFGGVGNTHLDLGFVKVPLPW